MNLHRTTGKPDWAKIKQNRRNAWQQLGAATGSAVTPGNLVTIIGLMLVLVGLAEILMHQYWFGAIFLAVGRLCDIADGMLADKTGTKSPLGELLDASIDKLGTFLTLLVLFVASVAPKWALLGLVTPHIIITFFTLWLRLNNRQLHPSRAGKLSMFTAWCSVLALIVVHAAHITGLNIITVAVYGLTALSSLLGLYALYGYIHTSEHS